jgi:WD40 repeat protein
LFENRRLRDDARKTQGHLSVTTLEQIRARVKPIVATLVAQFRKQLGYEQADPERGAQIDGDTSPSPEPGSSPRNLGASHQKQNVSPLAIRHNHSSENIPRSATGAVTSGPDDVSPKSFGTRGFSLFPTIRSHDDEPSAQHKQAQQQEQQPYSSSPDTTTFGTHDIERYLVRKKKKLVTKDQRRSERMVRTERTIKSNRPVNHPPQTSQFTPSRLVKQPKNRGPKKVVHGGKGAMDREIDILRLAGHDSTLDRPYLRMGLRTDLGRGLSILNSSKKDQEIGLWNDLSALQGTVLHVDFSDEEIACLVKLVAQVVDTRYHLTNDPRENIQTLMSGTKTNVVEIFSALKTTSTTLSGRRDSAILAFLKDAAAGILSKRPEIVRMNTRKTALSKKDSLESIGSILLSREIRGRTRGPRREAPSRAKLMTSVEDTLIREAEWTECAGDIATITWLPGDRFICGTVTHSDEHNQQYNKPGNLMIGSTSTKALRSIPGHQVIRPVVEKGDNSLPSMRETQDPWLYTSVTSTAFSEAEGLAFTGSYDDTVKVWKVNSTDASMELCGTWLHEGHVNFVVTSPHHGMVATAADVRKGAIRVYNLDSGNLSESPYGTLSGKRADEQALRHYDTWAYYPATIQWGKCQSVSHLLLAGYSPRSHNPHDDFPEVMENTGELCLWDAYDGSLVTIDAGRSQNVFEVVWHPTQPLFVAATSPTGSIEGVRTQLRLFGQTDTGSFILMKALDCEALDINEISIM